MKILVTGAAGFIGHHVCRRLVARKGAATVLGIDNLNDYYPVALKEARLAELAGNDDFRFVRLDFADAAALHALHDRAFEESEGRTTAGAKPAAAGVRPDKVRTVPHSCCRLKTGI